jgi:hypothetical protein
MSGAREPLGADDNALLHTLLKIEQESTLQAMPNPIVHAPFSSLQAGFAQGELL